MKVFRRLGLSVKIYTSVKLHMRKAKRVSGRPSEPVPADFFIRILQEHSQVEPVGY